MLKIMVSKQFGGVITISALRISPYQDAAQNIRLESIFLLALIPQMVQREERSTCMFKDGFKQVH